MPNFVFLSFLSEKTESFFVYSFFFLPLFFQNSKLINIFLALSSFGNVELEMHHLLLCALPRCLKVFIFASNDNSLVPEILNINPFAKICFYEKKASSKKISNERPAYESVDDKSLQWDLCQKLMENRIHAATKGWMS